MFSSKDNINILTSLLIDYGVEHIVVCPGSRNAPIVHNFNESPNFICHPVTDERSAAFVALGPIVHNFNESPNFICHPVTDERSAAFVALGIANQTGEMVAVCVTSGSALLNTLPGAAEASYQNRGIIVISADRPQAWIGQLDGQTMPQPNALGSFVEKSVNLPECKDEVERWQCRRLVCEAILTLMTTKRSVHINVPITEPLFDFTTKELPELQGIFPLRWSDETERNYFLDMLSRSQRPMIVIGQSQRFEIPNNAISKLRQGITILAEPLSSDDPSPSLDDTFVKIGSNTEEYKPDFLLYIGSTTISKRLRQFMRTLNDCTIVMLNEQMQIEDITQHASYILQGSATTVLEDLSSILQLEKNAFGMNWDSLLSSVREDAKKQPVKITEQAVQELEKHMTKESDVYYANSTAIRLAARHANHFVFCNRGLNGIEGSLSTAVGASLVSEGNVYCVIGDLSFFYDQNALWNMHLKPNLRILLLNKQLPGLEKSPARDEYVMASHHTTAVGVCHQYGISRKVVSKAEDISNAIDWLTEEGGNAPRLVEVASPPALPRREGACPPKNNN